MPANLHIVDRTISTSVALSQRCDRWWTASARAPEVSARNSQRSVSGWIRTDHTMNSGQSDANSVAINDAAQLREKTIVSQKVAISAKSPATNEKSLSATVNLCSDFPKIRRTFLQKRKLSAG